MRCTKGRSCKSCRLESKQIGLRQVQPCYRQATVETQCNAMIPPKIAFRRRRSVYRWTTEVDSFKKDYVQKKRLYPRIAITSSLPITTASWYNFQNSRNEVRQAKHKSWKKLIEAIDKNIWGNGYKISIKCTIVYILPPALHWKVWRTYQNNFSQHR